jgi:hypothetical protein
MGTTVAIKTPEQAGLLTRIAGLLCDDDGIRRINFRIKGRIRKEAAPSSVAERGW